jgi:osmotically-inducible protein OsmY
MPPNLILSGRAGRWWSARRAICEDIAEQLAASPFINSSGISITVDDSEVTLEGTINSLIAVSLARALALNVPGVSRVQVRLRVVQAPKRYATS